MALLEVDKITTYRGSQKVLDSVSFSVEEKTMVGIIGPNGAGKTTIFDAISGFFKPGKGRISFERIEITHFPPHRIAKMGLGRTFQIPRPFKEQTVFENVLLGHLMSRPGLIDPDEVITETNIILEKLELSSKKERLAGELTLSEQRRLEIARALATNPRLLLLDEVAAGLSPAAIDRLVNLLKQLNSQGMTIVIIDHFLNLTMQLASNVVVLDSGRKIAEGRPDEVLNMRLVRDAYLG
ncbi:MAG TPA: ABC transporter ATP-binding protein [Deltaproteobacteria bacterium]|nr:ABC transporter ATP-binding protein [Deltaproteobacteria bacterium]